MQIPSEYLNYAIGAVAALALAKFMGWLNLPFGQQANPPPPVPPPAPVPVYFREPPVQGPNEGQSYSAMIDIPHKITVTPQQGSK